MRAVIHRVRRSIPLEIEEIDVDSSPDLRRQYGDEVPVLLINHRPAFRYRLTERELRDRLRLEGKN
jgi:hypothetical protein